MQLKGFEEITSLFRALESRDSGSPPHAQLDDSVINVDTDSEDTDFEELPPFRIQPAASPQ